MKNKTKKLLKNIFEFFYTDFLQDQKKSLKNQKLMTKLKKIIEYTDPIG